MLRGGSAQQSSCSDLRTESTCKEVKGCKWYWPPPPPIPHAPPPYGVCRRTFDKASLPDAYVRLDADYGYEDNGAEVDKITPSARQFRCYDLHTESECEYVHGCNWIVGHQSHGHSFGSCITEYVYEYEEKELPNINDIYVSSGIESSSPRKGNLRAGESNRRWRLLPLDDQQQHKV
eukprot:scaffold4356_cov82-Skeletonema_dohrnii-CCMP3373.AAC.6